KVMINVTGNLTVDLGGEIDVSFQGYAAQQGPGVPSPTSSRGAAGHGGQGGFGFQATDRGATYGSITNPVTLGSGTKTQRGGGAIAVTISRPKLP
ncbi:MAG: hypothetical protein MK010_05090, partial [Erythrobacter sp.]|nr:hypothetical protein [Erythrobacter sp.]